MFDFSQKASLNPTDHVLLFLSKPRRDSKPLNLKFSFEDKLFVFNSMDDFTNLSGSCSVGFSSV